MKYSERPQNGADNKLNFKKLFKQSKNNQRPWTGYVTSFEDISWTIRSTKKENKLRKAKYEVTGLCAKFCWEFILVSKSTKY